MTAYVEAVLLPPGLLIWLLLGGLWLLARGRRRAGLAVSSVGLGLLYLLSTPLVGGGLLGLLQTAPPLAEDALGAQGGEAIVVLGAGRRSAAAEYGGDTVNALALERLRYAARIARRTGLPLLVSGGLARDGHPPEAILMMQALEADFGVPVRWVESDSRNTFDNARYSSQILRASGLRRILLVSHAWHMPRALWAFGRFGLQVTPAPTAFETDDDTLLLSDLLPQARALRKSYFALHEMLGNLWYRLRYS